MPVIDKDAQNIYVTPFPRLALGKENKREPRRIFGPVNEIRFDSIRFDCMPRNGKFHLQCVSTAVYKVMLVCTLYKDVGFLESNVTTCNDAATFT